MFKVLRLLVVAFLSVALASGSVGLAQTCDVSWDAGGTTSNWSELANWDGNVLPVSTDDVCHTIGGVIQCNVGSPQNPNIIASMHVSGASDGGLTIGGGLTDLRGLRTTNDLFDSDSPIQGGGYDVTVRGGSLLRALGEIFNVNVLLEAGNTTNRTTVETGALLTSGGRTITMNDHTRFEVDGDIEHDLSGTNATFTVAGSDAIVTIGGTVIAGDPFFSGELEISLDDAAQMDLTGSSLDFSILGGVWDIRGGSSLIVSNPGDTATVLGGSFTIAEGALVTLPGLVDDVEFLDISDTDTIVSAGTIDGSDASVSDGAYVDASELLGATWTVTDATVGSELDPLDRIQNVDFTISGAASFAAAHTLDNIGLYASDEAHVLVPDPGGSADHFILGPIFTLADGAWLDAPTAPMTAILVTLDDSTLEVKNLVHLALLPSGITLLNGADAAISESVSGFTLFVEYGGEENELSVTGRLLLGGPNVRIRMEEPGSAATLTLGVSRLDVETDLSEDTTAAQSWDTSGVTLGVIPPADPELENAGDIEVMNVLWDVDTAEPLIFCDTHTNKWAGFVVKDEATANLVDENENGYYGTLYSAPEVLIVLGDVLVADGAALNTDDRQVFYTGTLTNNGSIDNTSNLVQVDARHFGDFNGDDVIDTTDDFDIIRDAYSGSNDTTDPRCDADGDNDSDNIDYAFYLANRTAYGSDSLCSGGESFGGGGSSGCSSEVTLTEEQEAWVAATIAWCQETLTEELIAATAEAFSASS